MMLLFDATIRTSLSAFVVLLSVSTAFLRAEPPLKITSPADGTVVHPGQTLNVVVTTSPDASFAQMVIIGESPIGFSQMLTAPPYQFTIQIPANIRPRRYMLSADGATTPGHGSESDPISIIVERLESPKSLRVEPPALHLSVGEQLLLRVIGTFADGSTTDITESQHSTYESKSAGVATVRGDGLVTAVTPGATKIIVNRAVVVPVTVKRKGG